jgi:hypothetical protein
MERVGLFLAGFASGWAVRTTVDSSRSLAVDLIAAFYGAVDRAGRLAGMEREHLEDLIAEGKAKFEMDRARAARRAAPSAANGAAANGAVANGAARQDRAA